MAAKVTFDWDNLLIIAKSGVTELDVQVDLYSDWKEEVQLSDNMKHPPAMRSVGGDPISQTQNLGATFFLINGWRIRPDEVDHNLLITGNLFTDPAGESTVIPTLGTFTVVVTNFVSNLIDSSVARLDLAQLLNAVYVDESNGTPGTEEGKGTPTNPVDNITDAFTIANDQNLRAFNMRGSFTLDRSITDWTFEGIGDEIGSALDINGFDVDLCNFKNITISGTMTGRIQANKCALGILVGLDGTFRECQLLSSIDTDDDAEISFINCSSRIPGVLTPVIDVGSNNEINFRSHSGDLKLENVNTGTTISVDLDPGHLIIDSTCDGGTILVRGTGNLTDNNTGTTVISEGLIQGSDVKLTRQLLANRLETDPVTGILTIYDDDDNVLLTAQLYEDVSASQTYRGQGAERRNKLT